MLKQFNHRMTQRFTNAATIADLMYAIKIYGDAFYGDVEYEVSINTEFVLEPKNQYSASHITPYMNSVHIVQFYIYYQQMYEIGEALRRSLNGLTEPATLEDEEPTTNY